jgi:site-specific DNA recombinase
MEMALYARVSTERQEREQTVESQVAILKGWIAERGHSLKLEHVYVDQGYSGARLDRPGLDRLRDAAQEGEIDGVVVLTPDRLARKYAYQVLLLEEFKRVGCSVTFVHRPLSDDPNDQLLLQIQGAVAEYERAVLGERFRRGKLQKARSGLYLAGKAPYGYGYIPKREGVPGYLVIDDAEADLVRMLYRWLIDERLTIRQILKRLNFGPWYPRSGKHPWSPSVVHHILADPVYTGTAYANRYRYVVPKKPRTVRGPRTAEASCRQPKPKDEWIPIPVPALIDSSTFERAQEQLARNAALSFRHNTKYSYLLRCLLTCDGCGLAMFGRQYKATATQAAKCYYTCHGKDRILSAREERCPQRQVKAEELEAAVWDHVVQLLADPARLLAQFQSFSQAAVDGDVAEQAEDQRLGARIERLAREEKRLLDAYQAEVITLGELAQRREELGRRRQALADEQNQRSQLRRERARAQEVLTELTAFCERVRSRLTEVTFAEKQTILQLLIERIIVKADTLEIQHVIPLDNPVPGPAPPDDLVIPQLRSDGVDEVMLVLVMGTHDNEAGESIGRIGSQVREVEIERHEDASLLLAGCGHVCVRRALQPLVEGCDRVVTSRM